MNAEYAGWSENIHSEEGVKTHVQREWHCHLFPDMIERKP